MMSLKKIVAVQIFIVLPKVMETLQTKEHEYTVKVSKLSTVYHCHTFKIIYYYHTFKIIYYCHTFKIIYHCHTFKTILHCHTKG